MDIPEVRRRLLDWYDAHRRDLPWRATTDPYRVWVSEAMLQQTRVQTVLPYYARWLERFPDVEALAAADEQDVLAAWAGLGYYGRARRLHAAARQVVAEGMPEDAAGWRRLPGVGPYMSGAIASIAHGQAVPAIDGNVVRVVSRLAGIRDMVDRGPARKQLEAIAAELVDPARPGDWNQALMDLGSGPCAPSPDCPGCPLHDLCDAKHAGDAADLPRLPAKRAPKHEDQHFALLRDGDRVLVVQRPPGLLAGTWMLPGGDTGTPLEDHVRAQAGIDARIGEPLGEAVHVFTHRRWHMRIHDAERIDGEGGHWVDPAAPDVALSTAARKAVAAAQRM